MTSTSTSIYLCRHLLTIGRLDKLLQTIRSQQAEIQHLKRQLSTERTVINKSSSTTPQSSQSPVSPALTRGSLSLCPSLSDHQPAWQSAPPDLQSEPSLHRLRDSREELESIADADDKVGQHSNSRDGEKVCQEEAGLLSRENQIVCGRFQDLGMSLALSCSFCSLPSTLTLLNRSCRDFHLDAFQ